MTRFALVLSFLFSLGLTAASCDTDPQPSDTMSGDTANSDTSTPDASGTDVVADVGPDATPDVPTGTYCGGDSLDDNWVVCKSESKVCKANYCAPDTCESETPGTVWNAHLQACEAKEGLDLTGNTWQCPYKLTTGEFIPKDFRIEQDNTSLEWYLPPGPRTCLKGEIHGTELWVLCKITSEDNEYYFHSTNATLTSFSGEGYLIPGGTGNKTNFTFTCVKKP